MWVSGFGGESGYNAEPVDSVRNPTYFFPATMTTDETGCDIGYVGDRYGSDLVLKSFRRPYNPHPEN